MKDKTIKEMINYIESNLDHQLNLDEIAKKAGYSKFHFNRMFSDHVGYTVYKYIQMRRLTVAAEKLVYTKKPIIEIAYEANYGSQQSFTLAFHRLYDCTPQEYRVMKIHRPKLKRFKSWSGVMMFCKSIEKGGSMAA